MKSRVLVVGDAAAPTGFARVTESIVSRLQTYYDIHQLAVNYRGDPHDCNWPLYPASLGGDGHGVTRLPELIGRVRPDLVFAVNDLWIVRDYLEKLRDSDTPVVVYAPVDAEPLAPEWVESLHGAKLCVLYTDYGVEAIRRAIDEDVELTSIPHGVDTTVFRPVDRRRAKMELGITSSLEEPSFVVLNANRNQPRKRIDLTIKGFAKFAKDKPPWVKLFLHMGRRDMGWDIVSLGRRLGIESRMIISGAPHGGAPTIPVEKLNLVYNATEVGLNTSGGEGWGLTALEHAATGAAQIVPRHSACEEIWEGSGVLLDAPDVMTQPSTLLDFRYPTVDGVAGAIDRLFRDERHRSRIARACYQRALDPELSWDGIARRWHTLFESVLDGRDSGRSPIPRESGGHRVESS